MSFTGPHFELSKSNFEGNFHFTELLSPPLQLLPTDPPQWQYHLHFAADRRMTADRYTYFGSTVNAIYNSVAGGVGSASDYQALLEAADYASRLSTHYIAVGHTQIGQVKFDLANNKVLHSFWFVLPEVSSSSAPGPITKHEIDITPDS